MLTRCGNKQEGEAKGYDPKNRGRASHHPLIAFVANSRLVANFWLLLGNNTSSNDSEGLIQSTLENLGSARAGLFRSGYSYRDVGFERRQRAEN